jgi:hypothetical protein
MGQANVPSVVGPLTSFHVLQYSHSVVTSQKKNTKKLRHAKLALSHFPQVRFIVFTELRGSSLESAGQFEQVREKPPFATSIFNLGAFTLARSSSSTRGLMHNISTK